MQVWSFEQGTLEQNKFLVNIFFCLCTILCTQDKIFTSTFVGVGYIIFLSPLQYIPAFFAFPVVVKVEESERKQQPNM